MRTHYCVITALVLLWIILFIPTKIVACDKNELTFGDISICINPNGNILYKRSLGKKHIIVVDLPYKNTLHFVKVGNTNIVKVERYYNAWIVLLQTYKREDEKTPAALACDTKFKALIIRDDGKVFLSKKSNGGSGCPPINRDRLAFTILADSYVSKNDK